MSTSHFLTMAVAAGLFAAGLAPVPCRAQAEQEQSSQEEVLTRGPIHEAFATAVTFDPEPGLTISVKPPEPIDELPPEQQLEGDNVAWIPGYWAWDAEREDFLWVSGIWRNLPPDRQWVPGYWDDLGDSRYQWISGYWADATVTEVSYLPKPPKPLESRPNVEAPSSSHTWIPGNWVWVDTRYRWRPGYWEPLRENWTYVPDHYHWTPRGYIYIGGYWDYAPIRRGIIFAPVHFHRDYYRRAGFQYTPSIVISISTMVDHLFVRPSYGHYYFGDYYEPRYRQEGFVASFTFHSGSVAGYDPLYAYARWTHRDDRDWERRRREDFDYFRDHRDARPPRNWSELRELGDGRRGARVRDRDYMIATPLAEFAKAPEEGKRFRRLDGEARERVINRRKEMQEFRQERRQQESAANRQGQKPEGAEKVKVGRSPILGRRAAELGKEDAPPPRKEVPAPVDPDAAKDTPKTPEERRRPATEGETQPMPPDREREAQPQREREAKPQREREAKPQREREAKPQREPEAKPQREPEAKPQREPEAKPQREPEAKPQREPEAKPQREREAKPQREREAQPQREREAKPQREREVQPQREREAQPQREREAQPQREREAQPQREREAQPQREREAQPQRERQKPRDREKEEKEKEKE